jgi:hypothetical protein
LIDRALDRLVPELAARRRARRRIIGGVALVAVSSLPVVLAVAVAEAWLLFSLLGRFLPGPAAAAATTLVGASMLLVLALAYGSLPLVASWGLRLQEQTS